jgi:peptidoglycan/xylan/chitin deacetylase (PgdA/CDA1 family)
MYHRIADVPIDPWDLSVTPRHFAEQLSVLRRTRRPVAVDDFVSMLTARELPDDAVAVTFDDGYQDNLELAKPRLEAADIPATLFLATGFVGQSEGFWWDELAELTLLGIECEELNCELPGLERCVLGPRDSATVSRNWRAKDGTPTRRQRSLLELWSRFRSMDINTRVKAMALLRTFADKNFPARTGRPMTSVELRSLIATGLFAIGAHTVTHPAFSLCDLPTSLREVAISKADCEALANKKIRGFAYPFGDHEGSGRKCVVDSGFMYAMGIEPAPVTAESDVFCLPRIQVPDLDGDRFESFFNRIAA